MKCSVSENVLRQCCCHFQLQERLVSLQPEELASPTKTTSLPSLDDVKDPDEKVSVYHLLTKNYSI